MAVLNMLKRYKVVVEQFREWTVYVDAVDYAMAEREALLKTDGMPATDEYGPGVVLAEESYERS